VSGSALTLCTAPFTLRLTAITQNSGRGRAHLAPALTRRRARPGSPMGDIAAPQQGPESR
jgi:hypothetical protein